MADDSKSPLSRRVVESFADSVKAHVRTQLVERDAQIAALRERLDRTNAVVDGLLDGVRQQNDEIRRLRKNMRDVQDRVERK